MAAKRQNRAPEHPPAPPLPCATPDCHYEARVKVGVKRLRATPDGRQVLLEGPPWTLLCHSCNDKRVRAENKQWCIEHGFDTVEKQREFVRGQIKNIGMKREPVTMREPGDDDEEITA